MRRMGTQGGARCLGDTPHPWTRSPYASPIPFVTVCLSPRSARSTRSAVKPAICGLTAISGMARPVWTSAHASHTPAHARRLRLGWRPSSTPGGSTPPGGPSHGGRSSPHSSRAILSRHGLGPRQRRRRRLGPPGKPATPRSAPHQLWTADVTGHCNTGHGRYGEPLPVVEGDSRFRLAGQALPSPARHEAAPVFTRVFRECGRPSRIRTDHGVPFATKALARRSQLPAWWVRLGLLPAVIPPGHPHNMAVMNACPGPSTPTPPGRQRPTAAPTATLPSRP
jgi:hypothetical protein